MNPRGDFGRSGPAKRLPILASTRLATRTRRQAQMNQSANRQSSTRTVNLGGHRVTVGKSYQNFWDRVQRGQWEPTTLRAIDSILSPGDTYVDIGAWIGPTVLIAARKAGKVVAYEPDPVAAAQLRLNVQLNGLGNVEIHELALFDHDGTMSFGGGGTGTLGESVSSLMYGSRSVTVQVRDAAKESLTTAFQHCRLLKIDVEGAEYKLIGRIKHYLADKRPALILSTHSRQISGQVGPAGALRHLLARALLMMRLRHYRHVYVESRAAFDDAQAHWVKLSPAQRLGMLHPRYLDRDQEFLFLDEPLPPGR